ncbi:MAG: hypothetical protein ABIF10_04910, partial [Candidatus Woesearchaeota archaeon]
AAAGNPAVGKTYRGTLLAPNTSLPDYFAGIEITEKSSLKRLFGLWLSIEGIEAERGLAAKDTQLLHGVIDTISTKPLEERVEFCKRLGEPEKSQFKKYFLCRGEYN